MKKPKRNSIEFASARREINKDNQAYDKRWAKRLQKVIDAKEKELTRMEGEDMMPVEESKP